MRSSGRTPAWWRTIQVVAVLGAAGYSAWWYWQRQNKAGAALWAAGTDVVD